MRDPGPDAGWVRIPQDKGNLADAIQAAEAQGLQRVWIGPGLHPIAHFEMPNAVIFLQQSFILCGMGPDLSILQAEPDANGFLRISGDGEFILEGFTLTGGKNAVVVLGGRNQKVAFNKVRVFATSEYYGIQVLGDMFNVPEVLFYELEVLGTNIGLDLRQGRISIWRSLISGNGEGMSISWKAQVTIRESRISGNSFGGIGTDGDPQITIIDSEIAYNGGSGIGVGNVGFLELIDSHIFANRGYGISLVSTACGNQANATEGVEIRGRGNEIRDNEKGDLCPADYPWPPGFTKP